MILTNNFQKIEFESKDGVIMPADVLFNIIELAGNLQVLRNHIKLPISINSGYRSQNHNRLVGGVYNSYHTKGMASDLSVRNLTPKQVYNTILKLISLGKMKEGGLGLYNNFVHYDIYYDKINKRRWNGSYETNRHRRV